MAQRKKIIPDTIKSSLVTTAGLLIKTGKGPDELLGDLFHEVQRQRIYPDGKTFVDLVPKKRAKLIADEYRLTSKDPLFDLTEFVGRHFYDLSTTVHKKDDLVLDPDRTIDEHIAMLWSHLERRNRVTRGSLISLPYTYIVPGGRFNEQFYWDSYFIMLGLAAKGDYKTIEAMIKNYAYMIRKFGFIPTANRTYFASRSQPPFFAAMIQLLAKKKGKRIYIEYLPYLLAEYRFWMNGRSKLSKAEHKAYRRVVELPTGVRLNRFYDDKTTPRPESLLEDTTTAEESQERIADRLFLHLRAAAESGWDFSSRWFMDPKDIRTIHTVDILPVDLNCLLYQLETTISEAYRLLVQPLLARRYKFEAEKRVRGIQRYMWNESEGFFGDYNFHHQSLTDSLSLAGVFPLYVGIATNEQAQSVADKLKKDFLKSGGLISTLENTGQQWDAPNGWAPLQWVAIEGLRRYGHNELADEIKKRWLAVNEKVFDSKHKMIEKYDVVNESGIGGGGEYPLQDGFGWTNGVYAALKAEN